MRVLVLLLILSLPHASSFSDSQCHFNNNSRQCERDLVVPVYLKFHKVGSETVTQILHNVWRPYIKRWPSLAFSRDCWNDQFAHQVIPFSFCAPSFVRLVTRVVCRCMRHPLIAAAPCLLAPRPDARVAFLLLLRSCLSFSGLLVARRSAFTRSARAARSPVRRTPAFRRRTARCRPRARRDGRPRSYWWIAASRSSCSSVRAATMSTRASRGGGTLVPCACGGDS